MSALQELVPRSIINRGLRLIETLESILLAARPVSGMRFQETGVGESSVVIDGVIGFSKQAQLGEGQGDISNNNNNQADSSKTDLAEGVSETVIGVGQECRRHGSDSVAELACSTRESGGATGRTRGKLRETSRYTQLDSLPCR